MHNVRKVKTSEDKKREKLEQSRKKAAEYIELKQQFVEMRSKEDYSLQALKLTTALLNMSADCYSIWNFRKKVLLHLDISLPETKSDRDKDELKWLENILVMHPKSYWGWFHRKWITARIPNMNWEMEIALCTKALDMDQRNFHCWNYRRFVTTEAKVPNRSELDYTMSKIEQNFSNYSAWHQRSFLMQKLYENDPGSFVEVLNEELNLVQNAFYTAPDDQSTWFYHRWLMGMQKKHNASNFKEIVKKEYDKVQELLQEEPESKWATLTTVYLLKELEGYSDLIKEKVQKLEKVDPQRKSYYQHLLQKT